MKAAKHGRIFPGLTERQIADGFRALCARYIKSDYHSTYVQRRLGPRGFLEPAGDRYVMRAALLMGVDLIALKRLRSELVRSLESAYEQRQALIKKIEEACGLPSDRIEERRSLLARHLSEVLGNRGEVFEVVSFAVLREYFRTFGFSLQRFSTTHANDGGMDFVAGDAIYQVTVDESIQKVRKDLAKAPGTKRVLVRPNVTAEMIKLCGDEVLVAIDLKDLLSHFIAWLCARDTTGRQARHLQKVLETALEEFRRESKAERASDRNIKSPA
jgi:hypothetical protein